MHINSVSSQYNSQYRTPQPCFGRVIKTRFFEVLPNGKEQQILEPTLLKDLIKRFCFHLTQPNKTKKGRITGIPDMLSSVDSDYKYNPNIRRILNLNRPYDTCFYLITGKDADVIDSFAHAYTGQDKSSRIIDKHWQQVRNRGLRLREDKDEISLKIMLKRGSAPKTDKLQYYYKGTQLTKEKFMQFPYRSRNENAWQTQLYFD